MEFRGSMKGPCCTIEVVELFVGMSLMNRQTYNVLLAWHPGILDANQVHHSSNNISSKAVPLHQLLPSFLLLLNTSHPFLLPPSQVTVSSYALPPLSTLHAATTPSPTPFSPALSYLRHTIPKVPPTYPLRAFPISHPLLACS